MKLQALYQLNISTFPLHIYVHQIWITLASLRSQTINCSCNILFYFLYVQPDDS